MGVSLDQFKFSVGDVCESLLTSGLQQVGWGFAVQRNSEGLSEHDHAGFFELLIAVEVLLHVSADVSVGLEDCVNLSYVSGRNGDRVSASARRSSQRRLVWR